MEIKKSASASLENKQSQFLLLGLVVALGFLYIAFEWTKFDVKVFDNIGNEEITSETELDIDVTIQEETPPPPEPQTQQQPLVAPEINIKENDVQVADVEIQSSDDNKEAIEDAPVLAAAEEEVDEEEIFIKVEKQAAFPGGQGALMKWLSSHIQYPTICAESGIEGRVFVQFTVNKNGSIQDVVVLRGAHEKLNDEAVRVVKSMPNWTPAEQQGRTVRSKFTLPVIFKLAN